MNDRPVVPTLPLRTISGQEIALDVPRPFLLPITVSDADLDGQGHVNNSVYVRWMDRAAYAHSAALGYDWARYQAMGASFVVRRHEIDYLAPTFAGESIVVATWPHAMERFTAGRSHQIVRLEDGRTVARAMTTWVFLDLATGRPRRMPEDLIRDFTGAGT